jgi:hypothetical protein
MATLRRDGSDFALPTFILERYPCLSVLTCGDLNPAISILCQYNHILHPLLEALEKPTRLEAAAWQLIPWLLPLTQQALDQLRHRAPGVAAWLSSEAARLHAHKRRWLERANVADRWQRCPSRDSIPHGSGGCDANSCVGGVCSGVSTLCPHLPSPSDSVSRQKGAGESTAGAGRDDGRRPPLTSQLDTHTTLIRQGKQRSGGPHEAKKGEG